MIVKTVPLLYIKYYIILYIIRRKLHLKLWKSDPRDVTTAVSYGVIKLKGN